MSSAFRLSIVTDCPPYAAVNRRWPSFSGRRPPYLEQSSAERHVSTVTGHLSQSPQDSSLQALLSMTSPLSCRAREVTCHYKHVNRFCYLLTYLLTYLHERDGQTPSQTPHGGIGRAFAWHRAAKTSVVRRSWGIREWFLFRRQRLSEIHCVQKHVTTSSTT